MVPIRGVFEHINAGVEWDESNRTVIARLDSDVIRLPLNSYTATVNGLNVSLDSPATMVRGRAMVPLRFLSEALHSSVDWVASIQTVRITTEIATIGHCQPMLAIPLPGLMQGLSFHSAP